MLNLLANARDALDEGDRLGEKHLYLRTLQSDGELHIEIADNGPGIAEEHLARLFEPFFTTKSADRGTGLGLSISYAIVQDHGGRITCESRPGEGATFRVVLPVAGEH